MENVPVFLVVFLLVISSLLLYFMITRQSNKFYSEKSKLLPPSPPRLPIIGNLHQLGTHPHRSLRALSEKHGPLVLLHLGNVPTVVVSSADIVKEITKNHDVIFSNRPKTTAVELLLYNCRGVGFSRYGEYWRQIRRICVLKLLSLKRVKEFQFLRGEETAALVDKIRGARGILNLTELLNATSNNIISRCVLGRSFSGEEGPSWFGELGRRFMTEFMAFSVGDFFPRLCWVDHLTGLIVRLRRAFKELDTFLDEVVEEHKAGSELRGSNDVDGVGSEARDFADILLGLQRHIGMLHFKLTQDNTKAILADMLIGGTDTTSTTLEWMMAELLRNPTAMKRLQEEIRRVVGNRPKIENDDINQMHYLKCSIKETLRLHPPGPLLAPRETTADVEIQGFHIPKKTRVLVNAWAIQRDPKVWDNAEEFSPERFLNSDVDFKGQDFEFVPFGFGRRGCPAMAFGVAGIEFMIVNLLYWFDWKLPNSMSPQEVDMSEVYGLTVHKKTPLNLVAIPFSP